MPNLKKSIIQFILPRLVEMALSSFSPNDIKKFLDGNLTNLENYIKSTSNKVDDNLLPLLKMIRNDIIKYVNP